MNTFWKFVFWSMVIVLGFVNPVISFGLIILYYLPGIVGSICKECQDDKEEVVFEEYTEYFREPRHGFSEYSDDTKENMK